jgi:hypothetical protein
MGCPGTLSVVDFVPLVVDVVLLGVDAVLLVVDVVDVVPPHGRYPASSWMLTCSSSVLSC